MDQSTDSLIQLVGVSKVFYTDEVETHALSNVHLHIGRGEYISIAGPSGCGKTTLLSLLGLLDSPTEGEYYLDGKNVAQLTASDRARVRNREIGFIFQAFNLIGDLTVYENVELPLTYRGMPSSERKERVQAARTGITWTNQKLETANPKLTPSPVGFTARSTAPTPGCCVSRWRIAGRWSSSVSRPWRLFILYTDMWAWRFCRKRTSRYFR